MSRFFSSKYSNLKAYTPGEQPTNMKYIKLNTNESPYPPSEGVLLAVDRKAVEMLNLYPDPTCKVLKEKLGRLYGVEPANVFVSNGSDDILNFSFMAFGNGEERGFKFPEISYGFYSVYAELHKVAFKKIPLGEGFEINIEDYMGNDANIVIANPNAPTGLALSLEDIERLASENPDYVVIIDEAYVDFGAQSAVELTKKYENLLVVCTYSKSRSMAGARLGFAIGNSALIEDIEKIKFSTNPYSINRLTLLAGEAAIDDNDYYMGNCKRVAETREKTKTALEELGFYVTDSKANFLFAKSDKIGGEELYLELKARGVLVRHFNDPKISEYNRITVGTEEQMDTFVKKVKEILKEK